MQGNKKTFFYKERLFRLVRGNLPIILPGLPVRLVDYIQGVMIRISLICEHSNMRMDYP